MIIAITGAAGFIGSHLATHLKAEGHTIHGYDNFERGTAKADFIKNIDLRKDDINFTGVDALIHLASKVGGLPYYLDEAAEVFVENTTIDKKVFDSAIAAGVKRIIYASSSHVYDPSKKIISHESKDVNPELTYGMAKLFGERYLGYACQNKDIRYASLRLIGIYGEGQDIDLDKSSIIPALCRRAIEYPDTPYRLLTDGNETRTYCYIKDALKAFDLTLNYLEKSGSFPYPLNVGSEQVVTIKGIAEKIIKISHKEILLQVTDINSMIRGQECSCQSAKSVLGWESNTPFDEGLRNVYKDIESRLC